MSVPFMPEVPKKLFDTGLFRLQTHAGQHAFVDAVVSALHGNDPNWRHLKKKPGQTQVGGHGEDSALYLLPNNKAQAVDFIIGAGGPNPGPGWGGDAEPLYTHADAHNPEDHGLGSAAPPPPVQIPSYAQLGDDAFFRAMVGVPLQADYLAAGQQLNDGSSVWFSRTVYRLMAAFLKANGQPIDAAKEVKIVRNEWRAILGLPALP